MVEIDNSVTPTKCRSLSKDTVAPCFAFFALFLLFLQATAPAAAPDEISHFIRLGGIARGQLIGPQPNPKPVDPSGRFSESQVRRIEFEAGIFAVSPRYLYISGDNCTTDNPLQPTCAEPKPPNFTGTTEQISYHGRGLIAGYLGPAAFSMLGWSGRSTIFLARLGMVATVVALLSLAIVAVARIDPSAIVPVITGITVAYTPLMAYLSGVISPSAVGVAGNVALLCTTWALLRTKDKERSPVTQILWLIALTAACGAQRAGYVFALMAIVAGLLSVGMRPFSLWQRLSRRALGGAVLIFAGAFIWDMATVARLKPDDSIFSLRILLEHAGSVWTATQQAASPIGVLDTAMPAGVTALWAAIYAWCVMGAMLMSDRRWISSVGILLVAYFFVAIAIAHAYKPTGFGLQARFFLPGIVLFPVASLLHLAICSENSWRRLSPHVLYGLCAVGMIGAAITLVRRHVVGMGGPYWFFNHGEFRPLGGWPLFSITLAAFLTCVVITMRGIINSAQRRVIRTNNISQNYKPAEH